MTYTATFHPGATTPILTCYTHPRTGAIGTWTATWQIRSNDRDQNAALALVGVLTVVNVTDLDAAIADNFPGLTTVWKIVVTPTTADTQALRGEYLFGCDLTTVAGANEPLFDDATVTFGVDPVRPVVP